MWRDCGVKDYGVKDHGMRRPWYEGTVVWRDCDRDLGVLYFYLGICSMLWGIVVNMSQCFYLLFFDNLIHVILN